MPHGQKNGRRMCQENIASLYPIVGPPNNCGQIHRGEPEENVGSLNKNRTCVTQKNFASNFERAKSAIRSAAYKKQNDGQTDGQLIVRGNPGCVVRFRLFAGISRMGKNWIINEERYHIRIMKSDEESHQLTRRFGRYKKIPITQLNVIRTQRADGKQPDAYGHGG